MSIFKWGDKGDSQQTTTLTEAGAQVAEHEPMTKLPPRPAAAPGVVPPPAAPIYSTAAGEAQLSGRGVHAGLRFAVQRTRRPSPATGVPRQAAQLPVPITRRPPAVQHRQLFDPAAAAQTGLLNLAWKWQEAGSPIRAIHTYMELLARHPGTPAAAAAVADLVELSNKLADQGNFHTALGIYDEMEELRQMSEEA